MKLSRDLPCTPRAASIHELYGTESSRSGVQIGDYVDVAMDGSGYHWVLVISIHASDRAIDQITAPVSSKRAVSAPASAPGSKLERLARRISQRNEERRRREADARVRKAEKSALVELSERTYRGLLTNDPSPACTGCKLGREIQFGHASIKEVRKAPRGMSIAEARRNLESFIEESPYRRKVSADFQGLCEELGVSPTREWVDEGEIINEGELLEDDAVVD